MWAIAGAAGSVGFMAKASHNPSVVLWALFICWVLSPFVAAILTKRPSRAFDVATVLVTICSLVIYGGVAFGLIAAKVGFVFLVVPFASWVVLAVARVFK